MSAATRWSGAPTGNNGRTRTGWQPRPDIDVQAPARQPDRPQPATRVAQPSQPGTLQGMATMNGPDHYRAAEDLLDSIRYEKNETERSKKLQEAQVHATLALVVATLQGGQVGDKKLNEWKLYGKVRL